MLSQQKPPEGGHSISWAKLGWNVGLLALWQDTFSLFPRGLPGVPFMSLFRSCVTLSKLLNLAVPGFPGVIIGPSNNN